MGFELTTYGTRVSSHNHKTKAPGIDIFTGKNGVTKPVSSLAILMVFLASFTRYFHLFNTVLIHKIVITFLMIGFEPRSSDVGSDCPTNYATITAGF